MPTKNVSAPFPDIADELRDKIYKSIIPNLAIGISNARDLTKPSKTEFVLSYKMALILLFRLLFIVYSEDREILPYKNNKAYRKISLKNKATELAIAASNMAPISEGHHHWTESMQLWQVISRGNSNWGMPAFNEIMFSEDAELTKAGAALDDLTLPNSIFEPTLRELLLTRKEDNEFTPIDFNELSIRELGSIYEVLIRYQLSIAGQNLTRDNNGTYLPANDDDPVFIKAGETYIHDRSSLRKKSGSYYTPGFAVEHLLNDALKPALDEHLERISTLSHAEQTEQLFDFRVADIAMGSGHFLIAAIDHMENRFALWLQHNPCPKIEREIKILRQSANKVLGDIDEKVTIGNRQLLRRIIARRCIYGVDLNPFAVHLARLSIWIHTFVPGLPLSPIDHNLVTGNALIGISSLDEVRKKFVDSADTLNAINVETLLARAADPLKKLAKVSDASVKEILEGRALINRARVKNKETEALFDLITAQPIAKEPGLKNFQFKDWQQLKKDVHSSSALRQARKIIRSLSAIHFPIVFPEAFLGRTQGFNVILGNPPWEELKADKRDYWTGFFPGLRGLTQREQVQSWQNICDSRPYLTEEWENFETSTNNLADILKTGNFPGLNLGDLELYKAFCWRFWYLSSDNVGKIGVVLPRSAMAGRGSAAFRKSIFREASLLKITTLLNTGRWVFDMESRYTISLLTISKSKTNKTGIEIRGPYKSMKSYIEGMKSPPMTFPAAQILSWNNDGALPLLPTNHSVAVFEQLRKAQRLDYSDEEHWRARPYREMDASLQKHLMDIKSKERPNDFWPVYKGASYDLWQPDRGNYYAWANPKIVMPWLQEKRLRSHKMSRNSVHKEYSRKYVEDESTLGPLSPKIAFRLITNRTNRRTMVCALTPPNVFHANSSQLVAMPRGDRKDEAFLLGILSSIPLDWYARRFVEVNFNYFLFNPLPIPRPKRDNPLWRRTVTLAGRLACPDNRFAEWASVVGVKFGHIDPDDKQDKINELDSVVALLYGLSEQQLIHIFKTFHESSDYQLRLAEVMRHYKLWKRRN